MADSSEIQAPQIPGNYSARRNTRWSETEVVGTTPMKTRPHLQPSESQATALDAVHIRQSLSYVSPAQLYSTESGRLFHAGAICICLSGLPARGKTNLSISLCRYLCWLGVKTDLFHFGDYRRAVSKGVSDDFFKPRPETTEAADFRKNVTRKCIDDMVNFFDNEKGQVAIYDAVNALHEDRKSLWEQLDAHGVKVLFIESLCTDKALIERNIADAAKSPDYEGWAPKEAVEDYRKRIQAVEPFYEEMDEEFLTYVKFINFGDRVTVTNSKHDFLTNKIVFFLMNSRIKSGSVYFARCSDNKLNFKSDPPLSAKGKDYAKHLADTITNHISHEKGDKTPPHVTQVHVSVASRQPAYGVDGGDEQSFVVWTSTRQRTVQMSSVFTEMGIPTRQRAQLTQLNPGDVEGMSELEIADKFPDDFESHRKDPYHHRYSRAESYHDLAVKIEPLILEIERMRGDILIIADESVIKVFYGYLMACSCYDIPKLKFPINEIVQVRYNAYANTARKIKIDGVCPE